MGLRLISGNMQWVDPSIAIPIPFEKWDVFQPDGFNGGIATECVEIWDFGAYEWPWND